MELLSSDNQIFEVAKAVELQSVILRKVIVDIGSKSDQILQISCRSSSLSHGHHKRYRPMGYRVPQ